MSSCVYEILDLYIYKSLILNPDIPTYPVVFMVHRCIIIIRGTAPDLDLNSLPFELSFSMSFNVAAIFRSLHGTHTMAIYICAFRMRD